MISGLPVCSETSTTVRPAPRSAAAVPPVESSRTPRAASACASSTRPVLSDTDSSAVRTGTRSAALPVTELRVCAIIFPFSKGRGDRFETVSARAKQGKVLLVCGDTEPKRGEPADPRITRVSWS